MTTSSLYHTQGIHGFKYQKTERAKNIEIYYLHSTAKRLACPCCQSRNTSIVRTGRVRDIRGLCIGFKKTIMRIATRRILCRDCGASRQEPISFCSDSYVRHTKWTARFVLGLLGYWRHNRITRASQEGFNNKIGWLTRQAYGYHDEKYLHLKIYDLPNISNQKQL